MGYLEDEKIQEEPSNEEAEGEADRQQEMRRLRYVPTTECSASASASATAPDRLHENRNQDLLTEMASDQLINGNE